MSTTTLDNTMAVSQPSPEAGTSENKTPLEQAWEGLAVCLDSYADYSQSYEIGDMKTAVRELYEAQQGALRNARLAAPTLQDRIWALTQAFNDTTRTVEYRLADLWNKGSELQHSVKELNENTISPSARHAIGKCLGDLLISAEWLRLADKSDRYAVIRQTVAQQAEAAGRLLAAVGDRGTTQLVQKKIDQCLYDRLIELEKRLAETGQLFDVKKA